MRSAVVALICLGLAFPLLAEEPVLKGCQLHLDQEAQVPAQEAGVLLKILVREGQPVKAGDLLAQIDDFLPRAQYDAAVGKLEVAKKQATDDISVRYADAGAKVARLEYKKALDANKKTPGTFPEIEVERLLFKWIEMNLSIEKARKEMAVAALQMQVAEAEKRAAAVSVEHRRIIAPLMQVADAEKRAAGVSVEHRRIATPLNAVVVELSRHEGEWVQPGDTVMRLVRVDLLRVEGYLNAKDYDPAEIRDRPVEVRVAMPHGQVVTVPGRVVYVRPLVETGGEFLVRAEVENPVRNGVWVLTPGLTAEMTILSK